jgi:SNF2 family DNA or RNA helicase
LLIKKCIYFIYALTIFVSWTKIGTKDEKLVEELNFNIEKNPIENENPYFLRHPLKDYQVTGVNWMIKMADNGMSFILGDEMVCKFCIIIETNLRDLEKLFKLLV